MTTGKRQQGRAALRECAKAMKQADQAIAFANRVVAKRRREAQRADGVSSTTRRARRP